MRIKLKFNTALLAAFMAVTGLIGAITTVPVFADARDEVCKGVGVATGGAGMGCTLPKGSVNVPEIVVFVINLLSVIVGIVAVIMLSVGGFKYVTSQGEPNNIASAKSTIMYALVGLAIAVSSQLIVQFVLKRLIGS